MLPFGYTTVGDAPGATRLMAGTPDAMFIAGGTDMLQLLQEAVLAPSVLIDLNGLSLRGITPEGGGLRIGALTRLTDIADDERVRRDFPFLAHALEETASPQVRNMATAGGNLLQRTRCLYFRDATVPCNKRHPGSGCPAQDGQNRMNAILGGSADCIAAYPGDMANALIVLDAELVVHGPDGERRLKVEDLHREPGNTPQHRNQFARRARSSPRCCCRPAVTRAIPIISSCATGRASNGRWLRQPLRWRSPTVRCAPRVSRRVVSARDPGDCREVERMLVGRPLDEAAAVTAGEAAMRGAHPRPGNAFKVALLQRVVERALLMAGGLA